MIFESPKSLGKLVKNVILDASLIVATVYPWYVGYLSQQNNTKFFDQMQEVFLQNILGTGIGVGLVEGVRYIRNNYKVSKKEIKDNL